MGLGGAQGNMRGGGGVSGLAGDSGPRTKSLHVSFEWSGLLRGIARLGRRERELDSEDKRRRIVQERSDIHSDIRSPYAYNYLI